MAVDYVYRLDQPHLPGQLATVCAAIAAGNGLIGDIETVTIGRDRSIREINVEVRDHGQAKRLAGMLERLDSVRVITYYDRALRRHIGGKLRIEGTMRMESLQDMRDVYTSGVARVCTAIAEDRSLASRLTMIGPHGRDLHQRDPRPGPAPRASPAGVIAAAAPPDLPLPALTPRRAIPIRRPRPSPPYRGGTRRCS